MFSRKRNFLTRSAVMSGKYGVPSIVSSDLLVAGDLVSEGAIEVEGRIEGNINCQHVTVHQGGLVKGDLISETVHVNGQVDGLIKSKHVRLSQYARVVGVIIYETLSVEDGAYVDGQCKNMDSLSDAEKEDGKIRLVADNETV